MSKIFISQKILDSMFEKETALLEGNKLTILSQDKRQFEIAPAFKFLATLDGVEDPHKLVGKIFTKEELAKIDMDIYMDSAIYKDVPYQVDPGFVGLPCGERKPAAAPVKAQAPAAKPVEAVSAKAELTAEKAEKASEVSDQELLSDYLLKIL